VADAENDGVFVCDGFTARGDCCEGAPGQHTVAVTLNYDFTTDGACSSTVTKGCVQQFNIYDVTTGTPVKLFTVTAPAGASGPVTGITGTSALLTLRSGVHVFGATAQMADGTESNPNASTATATTLQFAYKL
jgi:hypothetical protein